MSSSAATGVSQVDVAYRRADLPLGPSVIAPECIALSAEAVARFAGTLAGSSRRRRFLRAIAALQPVQVDFHPDDEDVFVNFDPTSPREEEAFRHVMIVERLPDAWQYMGEDRAVARRRVEEAMALVRRVSEPLDESIHTIVGAFLMAKMEHYDGGSISSLMGAIWLGLQPTRPVVDFAETIVHEFVHQALFLDDMVNCIFVGGEARMAQEDGLVTSAIRRIKRGYDKAFHSAFVAIVLAEFYARLGMRDNVNAFLEPLTKTVSELGSAQDGFLTDHGRARLHELTVRVEEVSGVA